MRDKTYLQVTGIDFAADGSVFRSVSGSNELLFGMMPSGKLNNATQECSAKRYQTACCIVLQCAAMCCRVLLCVAV